MASDIGRRIRRRRVAVPGVHAGLHVATAVALLVCFRRGWVRVVTGLLSSLRYRRVVAPDERLVRFLTRYFGTRTLTPFAVYRTAAGLASLAGLTLT